MAAVRIALLTLRLVMRTKIALFFTFLFPVIFLFVYAGLFGHGNPQAVIYMFGPVVTLNIIGAGLWGLGMQAVVQRERGSLRRYRLAPIGPGTILSSNLLANYLLELPTIALLVFCAVAFFHMPLKINLLTLLILVTVGTFAFAGFGLTVASVANTMQEAQIYNNLTWLGLLFLSGVTVPLPLLPGWIQRLATFLPATYLVSAFQGIMLQSQPISAYWAEMLVLFASGLLGLLFARKLFRWEKEERIPPRAKLGALMFAAPFLLMGLWMNTRANPRAAWAMPYYLMGSASASAQETKGVSEPSALIENLEAAQASEELLKRWVISTDCATGGQSLAELSLVSPGAKGTQHALRLQGHLASTSKGDSPCVSAGFDLGPPPSENQVSGIEFWVRGDPRLIQVQLTTPEHASGPYPGVNLIPSCDWQSVRIPAAMKADSESGTPGTHRHILNVVITGFAGDFALDIDEISYY